MATLVKMGGPILAAANVINNAEVLQLWGDHNSLAAGFEQINNTDAEGLHPPILGEDIDVVSSDAADASAGTGARTVDITFLDENFARQVETVTMNGTTPVPMVDSILITYILEAQVKTTGTGLAAAGAITVAAISGGEVFGLIDAGATRMGHCATMIPADSEGYIYGFWADILSVAVGTGTARVALQIAEFGTSGVVASETWRTITSLELAEPDEDIVTATGGNPPPKGYFEFPGGVPYIVPAKAMIRLAGLSPAAKAVQAGMSIIIHGENAGTVTTNS